MRLTNKPIINFILAFLSFLSLTLLPAVANPQSCCMSNEEQAQAQACLCSQTSECCKESSPISLAVDRAEVTVKPFRHSQVPYNAPLWTPVTQVIRLAANRADFRFCAKPVETNNKRYLMLRVLLI